MVYVMMTFAMLGLILNIAAQTGSRRDNPAAQRPILLASVVTGVLTAIAGVLTIFTG